MIHKPDFHAIAKKIMRHQRGVREQQIIHPVREWLIGIAASVLLVGVVAYWAVVMYLEISNRSVEVSEAPTTEIVVYRPELINAALTRFGDRKATYQELLENRITTVQPPAPDVTEETVTEEEVTDDVEDEQLPPLEEVSEEEPSDEVADDAPVLLFD